MLELGYIVLFIILFSAILWNLYKAYLSNNISKEESKKRLIGVAFIFGAWVLLQVSIVSTGFYENTSLPPRIVLFIILPLFIFTGVFLYRNRKNRILNSIPIHIPIFYQTFRAGIELLFYFTFQRGFLPVEVTFEGVNYDVLFGISALVAGVYALRKNASTKWLIAWNILGIGVVGFAAFTFITCFYFPWIWGNPEFSFEFLQFPFILLPAFFMPSAIFVHLLSIFQLSR